MDSTLEAAYIINESQHVLHFNQPCTQVTNLVLCCITAVLFPDDSLLWIVKHLGDYSVWYCDINI
jgi:hypothetical protein